MASNHHGNGHHDHGTRTIRSEPFDASLWNKVHAMGQTMFDAIRDVTYALERGHPVHPEVAARAKDVTTCGFCTDRMNVYREHNQIFVRFGACGHLFHADPEGLREKTACYARFLDAKKRDPNACVLCRRRAVASGAPSHKRPRHDETHHAAAAHPRHMPRHASQPMQNRMPPPPPMHHYAPHAAAPVDDHYREPTPSLTHVSDSGNQDGGYESGEA